jgi:uncharacterized protein
MRFNPKADISSGRVSDAGGRGGGGGLGGALGGGKLPIPSGGKGGVGTIIAVVVMVAIAYFSGGLNSLTGGTEADTTRYDNCTTGADANNSDDCRRKGVEVSMSNYWQTALPEESDATFRDSQIKTFTGQVNTGGCGGASSAVGPFYCPSDMTIYLDSTFFPDVLEGQLGGQGGDFVEPYVLAHEYGHHIQNLMGTMNKVRTQQGPKSDAVRLELQADCYAGMWARSASTVPDDQGNVLLEDLSQQDISEALDSAKAVGDDRIQERSSGRVNPEQWTHGSAAQRQAWFRTGYDEGTLEACDTFAANAL